MNSEMKEDDSAADGGTTRPDALLGAISDLLLLTRRYQSAPDRAYANELAAQMIASLPATHHAKAAEIVSRLSSPPETLMRQLAFLSMEAAEIVLLSRHVTDAILMEAASKGFEYREIIARRPSLSEPVVNRLLFHEENKIDMMILPRLDLPLSENRASWLIERTEPGSALAAMLVRRQDLTPKHSLRLFWRVTGDHRKTLIQRFDVNPAFTSKTLAKLLGPDPASYSSRPLDRILQLIARTGADDTPLAPEDLDVAEKLLAQFRRGKNAGTADRVASACRISVKLAQKIMQDTSGESFAVLCAGMGLPAPAFKRLSAIRPERREGVPSYSNDDRTRCLQINDGLGKPTAVAILSYWDLDILDETARAARKQLELDIAGMKGRLSEFASSEEAAEKTGDEPKGEKRGLFGRRTKAG